MDYSILNDDPFLGAPSCNDRFYDYPKVDMEASTLVSTNNNAEIDINWLNNYCCDSGANLDKKDFCVPSSTFLTNHMVFSNDNFNDLLTDFTEQQQLESFEEQYMGLIERAFPVLPPTTNNQEPYDYVKEMDRGKTTRISEETVFIKKTQNISEAFKSPNTGFTMASLKKIVIEEPQNNQPSNDTTSTDSANCTVDRKYNCIYAYPTSDPEMTLADYLDSTMPIKRRKYKQKIKNNGNIGGKTLNSDGTVQIPFSIMAGLVLKNSPNVYEPLKSFYVFLSEHFKGFDMNDENWKKSLRHSLSFSKFFERKELSTDDHNHSKHFGKVAGLWRFVDDGQHRFEEKLKDFLSRFPNVALWNIKNPHDWERIKRGQMGVFVPEEPKVKSQRQIKMELRLLSNVSGRCPSSRVIHNENQSKLEILAKPTISEKTPHLVLNANSAK